MNRDPLDIIIIGLSLSSSWGNGHATTYRSLIKGLHGEGHEVTFLEQEVEWYASNRDITSSPHCSLHFYDNLDDLKKKFREKIRFADVVIIGSYVQEGVQVSEFVLRNAEGIVAFYDIDTPITLTKLNMNDYEYIHPDQIPEFDIYLSFSGGEVLNILERDFKATLAKPLYCSVDTDLYYSEVKEKNWQLGYLGTYSMDRQPTLDKLLVEPAKRLTNHDFVVTGPKYPVDIEWPPNVERMAHLPPTEHRDFYNRQHFTLNVTRDAMIKTGFSPSVRLFEAAACGTPIISDSWEGLDAFFEPGKEILVAESADDVVRYLQYSVNEMERISNLAKERVLKNHTSHQRARELVGYIREFNKVAV